VSGVFFNAGQVCSAGSRILVQASVYDTFVDRFVRLTTRLRTGDPLDPDTTIGPLISRAQQTRVLEYIERGRREGASLACGGAASERGFFVQPTVFTDVEPDMVIARDEIFGPVASVMRFTDDADAIRIANDSDYSLAAGVWTRDIGRAHTIAERLDAGTVWINTYGPTDTRLPWGGLGGDSGVGRDLGRAALDNYTQTKSIWTNLAPRRERSRESAASSRTGFAGA
jgi:aldehyde dehydrogenase (NAD+)